MGAMLENPYRPASANCDSPRVRRTLVRDLLPSLLTGLAVAFILYGLEILTNIGIPLVYSFPFFYPLREITYFDPLIGLCLQCMLYGIAVGIAKHFGRFRFGLCLVTITHVASVVLCRYLA